MYSVNVYYGKKGTQYSLILFKSINTTPYHCQNQNMLTWNAIINHYMQHNLYTLLKVKGNIYHSNYMGTIILKFNVLNNLVNMFTLLS